MLEQRARFALRCACQLCSLISHAFSAGLQGTYKGLIELQITSGSFVHYSVNRPCKQLHQLPSKRPRLLFMALKLICSLLFADLVRIIHVRAKIHGLNHSGTTNGLTSAACSGSCLPNSASPPGSSANTACLCNAGYTVRFLAWIQC